MRPPARALRLAGSCCAIALSIVAASAQSAGACPIPDSWHAFSRWGDEADYVLMPGGSFEDGIGWPGSGTPQIVDADNPLEPDGPGTRALRLGSGDSVTSPSLCIDRHYPHLRFLLRGEDAGAKLKLTVLWEDANGRQKQAPLDDHDPKAYRSWGISSVVKLRKAVPRGEGTHDIRLRFRVEGKAGAWLIDDVYVDPYKRS